MKKGLFLIGLVVVAVAVYFIFFNKSDEQVDSGPKQQPLAQSRNGDDFNVPFNKMLNAYFALHDALVNWDSVNAPKLADTFAGKLNEVPYSKLKSDTVIIATAKSFSDNILADTKGLAGEKNIAEQRHGFDIITDNLYTLIKTVRYDQQVIYHLRCPMAFGGDNEGFWLSNTSQVINPYLGNKHPKYKATMMSCGNVQDSVDFRAAK